jgi:malonyl-CoA O-methyltransferase
MDAYPGRFIFWDMDDTSIKKNDRVLRAFSRRSGSYTTGAGFQKEAASLLSEWLPDHEIGSILEVGAGSGLFSRNIIKKYPGIPLTVTDASEEMLKVCRHELINEKWIPSNKSHFAGLAADEKARNGRNRTLKFKRYNPEDDGRFEVSCDLVVSALTAQWFQDFEKGISSLADSAGRSGCVLLSYLTDGSFPEWKIAASGLGIPFTANKLPDLNDAHAILNSKGFKTQAELVKVEMPYPSALDFFRSLKLTGAYVQKEWVNNSARDFLKLIRSMDRTPEGVENGNDTIMNNDSGMNIINNDKQNEIYNSINNSNILISYNLAIIIGFRLS